MNETPTQRLASVLLKEPVSDFIARRRAEGTSWRVIARDLYTATDGQIDIAHETLRLWAVEPASA